MFFGALSSGRGLRRTWTSGRKSGRELRAFAGRSCGPLRLRSELQIQNSRFKIQDYGIGFTACDPPILWICFPLGASPQPSGWACDVKEQLSAKGTAAGCCARPGANSGFKIQYSELKGPAGVLGPIFRFGTQPAERTQIRERVAGLRCREAAARRPLERSILLAANPPPGGVCGLKNTPLGTDRCRASVRRPRDAS